MEISEFDDPIRGSLAQNEPQDDVSGRGKSSFLMLWTHSSPYASKIFYYRDPPLIRWAPTTAGTC